MPTQGEYMGMMLTIDDLDGENRDFFRYCAEGDFRLQRGKASGLLRYPPTTACPWTGERESEWVQVDGRGTVHSYAEVHHPIQPAFRDKVPYLILLVDLDTQKGEPSEHEALRVAGNLVTADGEFAPPEVIRQVGIGTRVRMVFTEVTEGFALPHWTIDEDAEQPEAPWRYPQE
ncbi:MAG: OB-fold domain-containing protein [Alphaproteobacteria bacterium]|jgi:hypothetical protein|nr:OB-fold domain-containing protein [Alphaproteobacteria bacterium]